jgi:hypothetical protein
MIITTKTRRSHPIASKIPSDLWNYCFDQQINEDSLKVSGKPLSDINRKDLPGDVDQALILLLIGYKGEADKLIEFIRNTLQCTDWSVLFQASAAMGRMDIILALKEQAPHELIQMIRARNYLAFRLASENGHLDTLKWFKEQVSSDELMKMIRADNYEAFSNASLNGHLTTIKWFKEQAPDVLMEMIEAHKYCAFRRASANGHLDTLEWFTEQVSSDELMKMIRADNYEAFSNASLNGHLDTLKWLKKQVSSDELMKMIKAYNYEAFRRASANGHLDTLKWFKKQVPSDELMKMIKAGDYLAFRRASDNGHLDTLKWLKKQVSSDELMKMIKADNYEAFRRASDNGHLDTLKWLKKQVSSDELMKMIKANNYEAFMMASANGHLDTLEWFKEQVSSDELMKMIRADNYLAFRLMSDTPHPATLSWFKEQAPHELMEMIKADNYKAFHLGYGRGDLVMLNWLKAQLPRNELMELVGHLGFSVLYWAEHYCVSATCEWILSTSPDCLAYAEMHEREYGSYTNSFIQNRLADLKTQADALQNPNAVFDITDPNEARICFYMIRNLIRRDDRALDDDIRFLLNIPSVKALAHREVTQNKPNELVLLALTTGNREAAEILLAIPAVRELAEANNFYQEETTRGLDLRQLANDRESSMSALTTGEKKQLDVLIKHYQPMLNAANSHHVIDGLREILAERYQENPAKVMVDGREVSLPLERKAFEALQLTGSTYEAALKAYYQHKDHTALRYLSKPNLWMDKDASYVYVTEAGDERWSTFEEYQPLISILALAALDKEMPPTEGHTYEGRVNHFFDELAHIGRAHNWDRSRQNKSGVMEEYDDLGGDKPSCYSGVKRRLFQSVIGHPLRSLDKGTIRQEACEFIQEHFRKLITDDNRGALLKALQELQNEPDFDGSAFKNLDINPEKQNSFIAYLNEKYGEQFTANESYQYEIVKLFKLNSEKDAHVFTLYSVASLKNILDKPKQTPGTASQLGIFGAETTKPQETPREFDSATQKSP